MSGTRTETDTLGPVQVPADAYWGAQTQRSLENFAIGDEQMPAPVLRAYLLLKQSAARANAAAGTVDPTLASAIEAACEDALAGRLGEVFPLKVWQTGSGTQTNMNVNEVLAHRATEILGSDFRTEKRVHPNDHVNRSQSSNDSFPTAMHVAAVLETREQLLPALSTLRDTLAAKASAWAEIVKTGRTHLMDATPLTLGQEVGGYVAQLDAARTSIEQALPALHQLALGGTAVGTGINAPEDFADTAIGHLATLTGEPFIATQNTFAELSAHDAMVSFSGRLKTLAVSLMHIANQIRLLGSGPRTGLAELTLPQNEPGSSIMPGKVNPTQCEALAMVCAQVMGNDTTVAVAGSHGHLQLNTFKPVIIFNVLQSIRLLADGCRSFEAHCIRGLEPNEPRIAELLSRSLMLVTALAPEIGYDQAAAVAKKAHAENSSLKEAALALDVLDEARLDALLDPSTMLR